MGIVTITILVSPKELANCSDIVRQQVSTVISVHFSEVQTCDRRDANKQRGKGGVAI